MKEALIQYVWQHQLFDKEDMCTCDGESLRVIFPGYPNTDAGPDFRQAVVVIGGMKWVGDVEVHLNSSDWYRHRHQEDNKYRSVVLHVVYRHDREVIREGTETYPTFELQSRIPEDLLQRYRDLSSSADRLPCRPFLPICSPLTLQAMNASMALERLLRKQAYVLGVVEQSAHDWGEALYRLLAMGFGFKTNAVAFELLARSLPSSVLRRHADSALQVEALVFGQSGLLERPTVDDFYDTLKYEYDYLRYKYALVPIGEYHWNLLRLRPCNFPCLRLSQFAALMAGKTDLMNRILEAKDVDEVRRELNVSASVYWRTHYHFGREVPPHGAALGADSVHSLIINVVVPFLFSYGRFSAHDDLLERAVRFLEELPFENNRRTRLFQGTHFPRVTALDSQALIELSTEYCQKKRCMECTVGDCILQSRGLQGNEVESR